MKILTAALIGGTMLASPAVLAADIYGGSTKDGPAGSIVSSSEGTVNFSGFYVGVQGGYGNANHNLSVNDYFKDFCLNKEDADAPEFNRFEDDDKYGYLPARTWTLENKLSQFPSYYNSGAKSCEELSHTPSGGSSVNDGYVTAPGDSRELGSIDGINSHGAIGGGRLGYDFARGRFLAGVFGEYNIAGMETTTNIASVGAFGIEKEDEWSIGARLGYIVAPRTLAYVLAAYTQTEYSVTGLDNPMVASFFDKRSGGATFDGISVGGGIEFALTNNVFFGVEYQHTFYDEENLVDLYSTASNVGVSVNDDLDEDKVMATLKFKLNGGLLRN